MVNWWFGAFGGLGFTFGVPASNESLHFGDPKNPSHLFTTS